MALLKDTVVSGNLRATDTIFTNRLIISSTTDAKETILEAVPLIIGNQNGTHLELDGNEIIAKSSQTTIADLYLNINDGKVRAKTFVGALEGNATSATNAEKIKQASSNTDKNFRILISGTDDDTEQETYIYKSNKLLFNPYSGQLSITGELLSNINQTNDTTKERIHIQSHNQTLLKLAGTTRAKAEGEALLTLGNNLSASTAYNATGKILLYSSGTHGHLIKPSATALNDDTDLIHTLPNAEGWLATGSTGGVGGTGIPIYLKSDGTLDVITAVSIANGGTGETTALKAITNLKGPYIAPGGTVVTSGNINTDYQKIGTYYTGSSTNTESLDGVKPSSGSGIKWWTIGGYLKNVLYQIAGNNTNNIYYRSTKTGNDTTPASTEWTDWYKFVLLKSTGTETVANNQGTVAKFEAVGNATKPVYVNANGVITACSDYAGAIPITWKTTFTKFTDSQLPTSAITFAIKGVSVKDTTLTTAENRLQYDYSQITAEGHHYRYIIAYGGSQNSKNTTTYLRLGVTQAKAREIFGNAKIASTTALAVSLSASTTSYINFETRAGISSIGSGTTTTETPEAIQGRISFTNFRDTRTHATAGNASSTITGHSYTKTRFKFIQYSRNVSNNSTSLSDKSETYQLPEATDNIATSATYDIYTTKTWPLNRTTVGKYWEVTYGGASCGYYHLSTLGPAGTEGCVTLYIGNATAKASAYNTTGRILLYSNGTAGHLIKPASTAISSTVNHVLPITAGWIATGGDGESTGVGDSDEPVYLSTAGVLTKCSVYAGGTKVTLNGTAKGATTASFYAPTKAGTLGYYLKSNGGGEPTWAAIPDGLPLQSTSTNGQFLKSNGSTASWAAINTSIPTAAMKKDGTIVTQYYLLGTDDSSKSITTVYHGQISNGQSITMDMNGNLYATAVHNAVWNDYAEYRESDLLPPGACVQEQDDGHLIASNRRLIPGASIITDTFGFSEGETDKAKTPIAVAGRVLAYTFLPRHMYHAGMAVCSAPGGTIDAMTREEIRDYPDAIIGVVSEIPNYDEWGSGHVKVNGRIWIKVK